MIKNENEVSSWFSDYEGSEGNIEMRVQILEGVNSSKLEDLMVSAIQTCYISKKKQRKTVKQKNVTAADALKYKLPEPGWVMAGDFGEILTMYFLKSEQNEEFVKIMKWRYKQDRNKSAPHIDVILLHRVDINSDSENDTVICAEAKLKSKEDKYSSKDVSPIESSIADFLPKRGSKRNFNDSHLSRMTTTLNWLKDREFYNKNTKKYDILERFTTKNIEVTYKKQFKSVSIIGRNFLEDELKKEVKNPKNDVIEVIVLGIDDLYNLYNKCYKRAVEEV